MMRKSIINYRKISVKIQQGGTMSIRINGPVNVMKGVNNPPLI